MHVFLKDHFIFLALSFAVGFILSIVYDFFRIIRIVRGARYSKNLSPEKIVSRIKFLKLYNSYSAQRVIKNNSKKFEYFLIFLEDILYVVILTLSIQILVFGANYGTPRLFSFCGVLCGFFLSRFTIGKILILFSEYIAYILGAILFYFLFPIVFLLSKIKKEIYKIKQMLYNINNKRIVRRQSQIKLVFLNKYFFNIAELIKK